MKKVVVIGLGYVGLPLALLLAKKHKVVGVDLSEELIRNLQKGETSITEEDVKVLVKSKCASQNFQAQTAPEEADIFVICVPTPLTTDQNAELEQVKRASEAIAPYLKKGNLVILESTVPPQCCKTFLKPLIEKHSGFRVPEDVLLAHCPERVLPGNSIHELTHNNRIIGGMDAASAKAAKNIYRSFVKGEILLTGDVTAELCKLAENAYRDVNIAFANEISLIAGSFHVDPKEVIWLANKHPRVSIATPGIGVGGHCLPVDPWFLRKPGDDHFA